MEIERRHASVPSTSRCAPLLASDLNAKYRAAHRLTLKATDGQCFAPAAQPVVVAEGSAAAGRDDDVQAIAAIADLAGTFAGHQLTQLGFRQYL